MDENLQKSIYYFFKICCYVLQLIAMLFDLFMFMFWLCDFCVFLCEYCSSTTAIIQWKREKVMWIYSNYSTGEFLFGVIHQGQEFGNSAPWIIVRYLFLIKASKSVRKVFLDQATKNNNKKGHSFSHMKCCCFNSAVHVEIWNYNRNLWLLPLSSWLHDNW